MGKGFKKNQRGGGLGGELTIKALKTFKKRALGRIERGCAD